MSVSIATAECFTHGIIAREIHCSSQGYVGEFGSKYMNNRQDMILICGMFIPTLDALKYVLNVNAPEPKDLIRKIKIYDQKNDLEVAFLMAKKVKEISGADIGIGTSAGIGYGGIAVVTDKFTIKTTSNVYADLCIPDSDELLKRQTSGVQIAINILVDILEGMNNNDIMESVHSPK